MILHRKPVHISFVTILAAIGAVVGLKLGSWYWLYLNSHNLRPMPEPGFVALVTVFGILVASVLASHAFRWIEMVVPRIEQLPTDDKVAGLVGVMVGLIVAWLLSPLVSRSATFGGLLVAVVYLFAVFLGVLFITSMKKELVAMFGRHVEAEEASAPENQLARLKLLDTNVIIDGRLLDVWTSGFVEGELLLPQFVLDELQQIADSADDLKRARGRRGLDLLNRIKEQVTTFRVLRPAEYGAPVDDLDGVDGKLIRLATSMDAAIVTNDFNLNRVADVQGVPVLNLNRLAMSLKPVVLAGEELTVNVIRLGRDPGQGVAYLDDGTMVVVEDGEHKVGRVVDVVVTSLLQTVQGKMIFAVLRDGDGHSGRGGNR
ncbi:MAG: TRAM domain-containing protein [Armatimonadetes bacterium]|nr:TRAM domain-containing protein [Armatimonadota bacterium]